MEAKDTGVIMGFGFIVLKNREKIISGASGTCIPPEVGNLKK
jgi:hypothetical protein